MRLSRSHTAITSIVLLLLLIFFVCACQVNVSPKPTTTTVPLTPASTLPATPTFAITLPTVLLPSRTLEPTAMPTLEPSVTVAPAPLSAGVSWLLYQRFLILEGGFAEVLFLSNQDGSAIQSIIGPDCEIGTPISILEDPANRLVMLDGKFVLINLDRAVVQPVSPDCRTKFTGSAGGGLLATIDRASAEAELRVYELPEGKLRSVFSIPQCSRFGQACGFDSTLGKWVAQWDADGRYLIFPVILDGATSDLYLYDTRNSATRQLASVQGWVSRIWWSPGGTNILLGVSPSGDFFLESFWVVQVASGEARRLSAAEEYLSDVEVLDWLDENRFLFYSGSLKDVVIVGAYDLRMLDIRSNQETTLLGDGFLRAGLDRQAGTVGMIVAVYNGQYEDGVYLIPAAEPTPQKIAPVDTEGIYNTFWDESLGLFVTGDPCQDGLQGFRAFDSKGSWHCTPGSLPSEIPMAVDYPSPDGQWRAVSREGLWVESTGKPAVKVHDIAPTQVIWRLDSGGLFFIASRGLYYVSLPDLAVQTLDHSDQLKNGLWWGSDQMEYQWIANGDGR
jgi:hypothetical protein